MSWFRNVIGGSIGSEMSKLGSMANQDPHFARALKDRGIKLTHEIQELDKIEKAFMDAIHHHLAKATKDDEEKALKVVDKILKNEDLAIGNTINIAQMLVRSLRNMFKEDVLIKGQGFSPQVAAALANEVQLRLAKVSTDLNHAGNILIQVAEEARKAA